MSADQQKPELRAPPPAGLIRSGSLLFFGFLLVQGVALGLVVGLLLGRHERQLHFATAPRGQQRGIVVFVDKDRHLQGQVDTSALDEGGDQTLDLGIREEQRFDVFEQAVELDLVAFVGV